MKLRALLLSTFYFFLFFFISCQKEQVSDSADENRTRDSLALHVAVMPVMDCLPIYYAQHTGMFEAEDLDVRLEEYLSQMDCDTAIQYQRVEMAYTDILRVLQMKENVGVITVMCGKLSLLTAHTKRIRQLKHLNERMIALDRLSTADYWSDKLMSEAGLETTDIYRPQINDLRLRTSMLTEQLVDAALLPEPYATQAAMVGNKRMKSQLEGDSLPHFNCLAIQRKHLSDKHRKEQIKRFMAVYDKAVKAINSKDCLQDTIRNILNHQYAMPTAVIDTLKIPPFLQSRKPSENEVSEAIRWLQSRERAPKKQRCDSLLCKFR